MKTTAVLHAAATVLVGVGIVLLEGLLAVGAFVVGGILFAAGIVVARRNDTGPPETA